MKFKLPDSAKAISQKLLSQRLRLLETERKAARLYLGHKEKNDAKVLTTLLMDFPRTRAGAIASDEELQAFRKSLPDAPADRDDDAHEIAGFLHGTKWKKAYSNEKTGEEAGTITTKNQDDIYRLHAPHDFTSAWILTDHAGSKRGYVIRWAFPNVADADVRFLLELAPEHRIEISRKEVDVKRLKEPANPASEVLDRRDDLLTPTSGGRLSVVPKESLVLVYLDDLLLFALPPEYAPKGRVQAGVSAGALNVESIRAIGRNRFD